MSQLYENEDDIPTAQTAEPKEDVRTIHDSGWWAGHALIWPVFILAGILQIGGMMVEGAFGGIIGGIALLVAFGSGLVFAAVTISAWAGYYYEAKLLRQTPDVDWSPWWWAYMIATPILSPFVVAPIYLIQRHRHVGVPWRNLALWR